MCCTSVINFRLTITCQVHDKWTQIAKRKKHFDLNGCFQDSKIDSCPVPTYGILIKTQLLQLTFVSKTLDDFLLNHYLTKY